MAAACEETSRRGGRPRGSHILLVSRVAVLHLLLPLASRHPYPRLDGPHHYYYDWDTPYGWGFSAVCSSFDYKKWRVAGVDPGYPENESDGNKNK